jgi:hypothetical protein
LADLLANVVTILIGSVLGLIGVYLIIRVGTMAVLKSIDDFRPSRDDRKQQLAKEG